MGKVLRFFNNGTPGAIARALDDVVISMANRSGDMIPFGAPLALGLDRDGVVPFDPSAHAAEDFVGVSVRNPAKTPDTYGADQGSYAPDDLVDVLVRGHIVVPMGNYSARVGDPVSIDRETGGFTVGSGNTVVPLDNVHISGIPDIADVAEIVLNTRNII